LYQFKSWYTWPTIANRTFLRQILEDYERVFKDNDVGLFWIFQTSLSTSDIVDKMKTALQGVIDDLKAGKSPVVPGYTESIALFLIARVGSIVKTVAP